MLRFYSFFRNERPSSCAESSFVYNEFLQDFRRYLLNRAQRSVHIGAGGSGVLATIFLVSSEGNTHLACFGQWLSNPCVMSLNCSF